MGWELQRKRGVREVGLALARSASTYSSLSSARHGTRGCGEAVAPLNASLAPIVGVPVEAGVDVERIKLTRRVTGCVKSAL